jgi:hypothetical protein
MELTAYSAFKLLVVLAVVPVLLFVRHVSLKRLPASNPVRDVVERHGVYKVALMYSIVAACVLGAVATISWS